MYEDLHMNPNAGNKKHNPCLPPPTCTTVSQIKFDVLVEVVHLQQGFHPAQSRESILRNLYR
jgi:hypothetical protein